MVDTESEAEPNDSIDFTKELTLDISIQTKVRTAIKTIPSDLLNRLPKLTWGKLDIITKYVRDDKYHTFDSFLQDVQSVHIVSPRALSLQLSLFRLGQKRIRLTFAFYFLSTCRQFVGSVGRTGISRATSGHSGDDQVSF